MGGPGFDGEQHAALRDAARLAGDLALVRLATPES
jgi:hypothetical protein